MAFFIRGTFWGPYYFRGNFWPLTIFTLKKPNFWILSQGKPKEKFFWEFQISNFLNWERLDSFVQNWFRIFCKGLYQISQKLILDFQIEKNLSLGEFPNIFSQNGKELLIRVRGSTGFKGFWGPTTEVFLPQKKIWCFSSKWGPKHNLFWGWVAPKGGPTFDFS